MVEDKARTVLIAAVTATAAAAAAFQLEKVPVGTGAAAATAVLGAVGGRPVLGAHQELGSFLHHARHDGYPREGRPAVAATAEGGES